MEDERESSPERIEKAALSLFAEHGYDAVGVRDIARLAKVPVSAINYYFGSKEALYRECTRKLTREYVHEARALLGRGAGLAEILEHYLDFASANPRLIRMWIDVQLSGDGEAQAYSNREIMGPVWHILCDALSRERKDDLDGRLGVLSFVGAVVLGAILSDEQMESLIEAPSDAARTRWRGELLARFASWGPAARVRAAP